MAQRKKLRTEMQESGRDAAHMACARLDNEEEDFEHPHVKQVLDLLAWHVGVLDARWYVKPRSTCWFEEYLFNIYTPTCSTIFYA